jgi:hypothetical protein
VKDPSSLRLSVPLAVVVTSEAVRESSSGSVSLARTPAAAETLNWTAGSAT